MGGLILGGNRFSASFKIDGKELKMPKQENMLW